MITPQQVLDTPMRPGEDVDVATVRDYLKRLLSTLWREESDFSGKRPFGNSGWQYAVYRALVQAGLVPGSFDEDGYLEDFPAGSQVAADRLIQQAIEALQ